MREALVERGELALHAALDLMRLSSRRSKRDKADACLNQPTSQQHPLSSLVVHILRGGLPVPPEY